MSKKLLPPLAALVFPAALALLSLAISLTGHSAQEWLRYERDAIAHGEIWRLITGHFTHLGWSHLWLNLAGLALITLLVGETLSFKRWCVVFAITALVTSGGLWFFQPQLVWYVGLSGVLHGLLVTGALASWGRHKDAPVLLALVVIKVAWEQWMGPMPGSEEAAGGPVIVAAHSYGAVGGALAFLLLWVWGGRKKL